MKRLKPWIITAFAAALALSVVTGVFAQGGPPGPGSFPSAFHGTVTSPDGVVPAGLTVEAYVGEREEACNRVPAQQTYRTTENGQQVTKYVVHVSHTNVQDGCGTNGADVRFKIGDRYAVQTGSWNNSIIPWQTLNLTLAPEAPETVTVDVAVWRNIANPTRLYISTRAPGGDWITRNDVLTMTPSTNPRTGVVSFDRSDLTAVEVVLGDESITVDVAVWRNIANPTRLYISTRAPGGDWITRNDVLTMTPSTNPRTGVVSFDRSDLTAVEVQLGQ